MAHGSVEVGPIKSTVLATLQALKYETSTPQGRANAQGNITLLLKYMLSLAVEG